LNILLTREFLNSLYQGECTPYINKSNF